MAKNTFYFPHDFEPTSDPKIQAMIGNHGGLGYGIYWRIIEMLHSNNEHKLPFKKYIIEAIAKQMQANAKQVDDLLNDLVNEYELLQSDGNFFWSNRVNRNFELRLKISEVRKLAGQKGGKSKQLLSKRKQTVAKERKGKIINTKVFISPTQSEVENYFSQNKELFKLEATKKIACSFFDYYSSNGWKVGGKAIMKDWQAAARNWVRNEKKFNVIKPNGKHEIPQPPAKQDESKIIEFQRSQLGQATTAGD